MTDSQTTIASLRELNSKLKVEITELRKKYSKVEAENMKLRQIIKENTKRDARVEELEQKNIELEIRLVILEQEEKGISTKDALQSLIISCNEESNISSHEVTTSGNSDTHQELETFTSPTSVKTISLEEKEENEFLDSMYKEQSSLLQTEVSELKQDNEINKNQIVEHDLIQKLHLPTKENDSSIKIGNDQTNAKVSTSSNSTHGYAYFHNKILGRYPDIYREFSSKKFNYYEIIDKSLCPICKLNHRDEKSIRDKYEAGSYFIKYEQQEIEIIVKILTDDYCKWHANLVDLPSFQTEKIHSRLYRAYTEETKLDP
ncbi:3925_t:CDS:2 [Cetraspora pellucida]|uniref:3925_t:CDS:1 n=1 Tax=Cetraspora pellucida TaxID=1433469 RepID=A0A9N9BYT0_9GLOM|nr:3925_t:CDS:2 [Cetraspora pellucida]